MTSGRVDYTCGGCRGEGAHRRWCEKAVGRTASHLGEWSEQADHLADMVGSTDTGAANMLYAAAGRLRRKAEQAKAAWAGRSYPEGEGDS